VIVVQMGRKEIRHEEWTITPLEPAVDETDAS